MTDPANPSKDGPPSNPPAAAVARHPGHELPFVTPSTYLHLRAPMATATPNLASAASHPSSHSRTIPAPALVPAPEKPLMTPLDRDQVQGLTAIREFLKVRTSYDVLPLSFRLIMLDNDLLIRTCLNILMQNSIVSAPLWDSKTSTFAGLLTSTDFINVIQYYMQFPEKFEEVENLRLSSLRDVEKALGVTPLETVSVHPGKPLYEACRRMLQTRARRIPLVDIDDETGRETVVSVITQYRILKFIAVNNERNTTLLRKTVRELNLGTYTNLATATMTNSVVDVIQLMVQHNISAVPILDRQGHVMNVFEAVDVIPCIKGGAYDELTETVGDAMCRRSDEFQGIYTCTEEDRLDSIFETVRKSRVHRLIVVDDESKLRGIISLSDILKYVLINGEEEHMPPEA
ncbi:AMP-activated serine/threonine-protein kinase regulatory subunit [Gnomoniopsis smithogilvyi]|uniref:AMP-activated serine/threonine-protein kinase regulatory subunit n=1 Tax=Gnomoniopsis smithogilvyi TaxID=1191159 RepID=A0A9W8YP32_9PEZI|nr:AMP-activated serine/threonine-protein kinase regulatory subunit [Gnomoniopsis smithogilvyi]